MTAVAVEAKFGVLRDKIVDSGAVVNASFTERLIDYLYPPARTRSTDKTSTTAEPQETSNTAAAIAKGAPPSVSVVLEHRPQVIDYRPPGFDGMTPFRQQVPGSGVAVAKVRAHSLRDRSEYGQEVKHLDYLARLRRGREFDECFNDCCPELLNLTNVSRIVALSF